MQQKPTTANSQRGYHHVAGRISRYIAENGLEPGARLPGEIDLANMLGVSRALIREARVAMEVAGEVEVRGGSGAYVCEASNLLSRVLGSGPGPFELLRARHLIEGEVAADAALSACTQDLIKIEKTLIQMKRLVSSKASIQTVDREFHVAIGQAAKNSVLADIVDGLWASMSAPMYQRLNRNSGLDRHQVAALEDHEAIFSAIANRDPGQARRMMRQHLRQMEEYLANDKSVSSTNIMAQSKAAEASPALAVH